MAGYLRALLAELIGTFFWVCLGAGAACADAASGGHLGPSGVALAQGLAVAALFGALGPRAIALFNPAFTVALAALHELEAIKAALCLLCQLLGAALAGLFLALLFPQLASQPPFLGAEMTPLGFRSATLLEAVLTFLLALASYRLLKNKELPQAQALIVGAFVAAASLFAGGLSGAAMNPARAFGPAVASGFWTEQYVYWIGPLAGALAGFKLCAFLLDE